MPESYSSGRGQRPSSSRTSSVRSSSSRYSDEPRRPSSRSSSDPYRSTSSTGARRPSGSRPSGTRSAGSRPSGYRPSGTPQRSGSSHGRRKRKKSIQPRFFLMIAVLVVIVVALIVVLHGCSGSNKDANTAPIATPTADPSANTQSNVVISTTESSTDGNTSADTSTESFDDLNGEIEADEDDDELAAISEADRVQVSAEDLSINTSLPDTWINILLLGTDERTENEAARTDTMIICSINKETSQVKLTSIMRDSAIQITGTSKYDGTYRINTANYFGGPYYAIKVVNELLQMNIQYYATVNFFGFQRIATALGGIDVDISEAEMNEINKKQIEQAKIAYKYSWDEGEIENELLTTYGPNTHLNGRQTVAYARVRKIDSDFSRTERQRTVLVKLMEKLKGKSMAELAVLGSSLISNVTTNMDFNTILDIATKVLSSGISIGSDQMLRLPMNGTYTEEVRNEDAMFYDIDWDTNAKELYNFIYVK